MTVLIPVRASDLECEAINFGIEYVQTHNEQLRVFLDFASMPQDFANLAEYIQEQIGNLTQKLADAGVDFRVDPVLNGEDLVEKIAAVVDPHGTDTVIVTLKSKTSQVKVQLGSQIQRILLDVPCSVLVRRPSVPDLSAK
ncbi:universal stress protein [Arcanobacterium bovis]|uniref:Universal stress protein n=1 Tax=Arcanobacterium bovis TaxID=2529275 RepID=A0A4Q9V1C5_9ACTO|nr:universal stress protein [Arcanobacterium bovis]TBW22843.1 universal stress protein [Arcanobacterium bovis]